VVEQFDCNLVQIWRGGRRDRGTGGAEVAVIFYYNSHSHKLSMTFFASEMVLSSSVSTTLGAQPLYRHVFKQHFGGKLNFWEKNTWP
jgi:hypothetical protein